MGGDGEFTMCEDLLKGEFAASSVKIFRTDIRSLFWLINNPASCHLRTDRHVRYSHENEYGDVLTKAINSSGGVFWIIPNIYAEPRSLMKSKLIS